MEIYLEDTEGQLCFKHAVKKAMEGAGSISIRGEDTSDCGMSGAWWIGGCYECEKERKAEEE